MIIPHSQNAMNTPDSGLLLKKLLLPSPDFELHGSLSGDRESIENYVKNNFKKEYGADVSAFSPQILTMRCGTEYSAATGLQQAQKSPLNLESYLSDSIENTIADKLSIHVQRQDIVEIGNLVATQRGASHLMFLLIAVILTRANKKLMVFTATSQVAKILKKLSFKTEILCQANPSEDTHKQWGTYYETNPHVLVGDLRQANELFERSRMMRYVLSYYADNIEYIAKQIH
jgi:hypothetical protein